jgi:glycosyltransferase involved in cell wall biosynthesis
MECDGKSLMTTRIVLLANNIDELGGAQKVVQVLAGGFALRGYDVTIVGVEPIGERTAHVSSSYQVERLLDVSYPKEAGPELDALREGAVKKLQKILDSGDPGIIISAQVWAMEHALDCDLTEWSTIGQFHSSIESAVFNKDLARILRTYRDADAFLALTDIDAMRFTQAGLNNSEAMPNPLAQWPETIADPEVKTITYLGRLSAEKAPMTLVQAWRILCGQGRLNEWSLNIIGSGPHDVQIEAAIADLPRVQLLPPVSDPYATLQHTGILAVPSLVEGLPLAVMEALASGVPVVASDCSAGVRELLDNGACGVLVNRGDAADLARGLCELAENDHLRSQMANHGRQHIEKYRLESVLDQWEELFASVQR